MKAVVLEVGPKYSVLLTGQGEYVRVRTLPSYRVGGEIEYPAAPAAGRWLSSTAVAAVLLLCIGFGGFAFAFATPYGYVNLDVNPSVELTVNRFDYIIGVKGLNPDGEALLAGQSLICKPLKEGVETLIDQLDRDGYLPAGDQSMLVLTFVSEDQRKLERFDRTVDEAIGHKLPEGRNVEVYVIHTDLQTHSDAERHNLSPGRLLLIEELRRTTKQGLDPAAMKEIPIKEIVRMVRENSPEAAREERIPAGQGLLKHLQLKVQQERQESREKPKGQYTRQVTDWLQNRLRMQKVEPPEDRENRLRQEREDRERRQEGRDNGRQPGSQESRQRRDSLETKPVLEPNDNRQVIEKQENKQRTERREEPENRQRENRLNDERGQEFRDSRERQEFRDSGQQPGGGENRQQRESQDPRRLEERNDNRRVNERQENRQGTDRREPQDGRQEWDKEDDDHRRERQDDRQRQDNRGRQEVRDNSERQDNRDSRSGWDRPNLREGQDRDVTGFFPWRGQKIL